MEIGVVTVSQAGRQVMSITAPPAMTWVGNLGQQAV
jgi:hypothetical protein